MTIYRCELHSNSRPPMFSTPSDTRGDVNRGVVYLDRFPGAVREMSSIQVVQDKLHDLMARDRQPNMRDAHAMHALLLEVIEDNAPKYRHVVRRGNTTQLEQLYRNLRTMHVKLHGTV